MLLNVLIQGSGFPRLRSTVTLVQSQKRNILVDSGLRDDADRLVLALKERGLTPDDVDVVVATHLHYDHCGNHLLFRNARYIVGAKDFIENAHFIRAYHQDGTPGKATTSALLRENYQTVKDFYVRSIVREVTRNIEFYNRVLEQDSRFVPVDGSHWLTEEVEVLPTPGHTHGHISVVAHRAQTGSEDAPRKILVAGDALFTRKTLLENAERELQLAQDVELYSHTRRKLLSEYRHIIPGHDGLVDRAAHVPLEATS
ncbi:MBL fold metallo-hydrolase [Pyxidicoccus sp. MSG2]|uniref:MBL fold metallo-hydrolase n=1 Tax=Pyxidicoccus sp. MSG2 TaxID=2996790 RepID=UPI002272042F|nr:MBL fold metallo-hydrolase [Pyxidicoccus sp. MSG2]MCY1014485.1 MBL fold metallo-hydrolase [Pyxidicoccus sp. MSG2]